MNSQIRLKRYVNKLMNSHSACQSSVDEQDLSSKYWYEDKFLLFLFLCKGQKCMTLLIPREVIFTSVGENIFIDH